MGTITSLEEFKLKKKKLSIESLFNRTNPNNIDKFHYQTLTSALFKGVRVKYKLYPGYFDRTEYEFIRDGNTKDITINTYIDNNPLWSLTLGIRDGERYEGFQPVNWVKISEIRAALEKDYYHVERFCELRYLPQEIVMYDYQIVEETSDDHHTHFVLRREHWVVHLCIYKIDNGA